MAQGMEIGVLRPVRAFHRVGDAGGNSLTQPTTAAVSWCNPRNIASWSGERIMSAQRYLLLGILALQNNFSGSQVVAGRRRNGA
jgi:hypothetical protein